MRALRLFGSALAKFDRDRGFFLASGIAFQVLLCLVPLVLLVLSFAGSYLFAHERLIEHLGRYLERAAPALDPEVRRNVLQIVGHRRTNGIIGTIGLLWVARTVFGSLRVALNTIFGVPKSRSALRGLGLDLLMILVTGGSFLLSVGLTAAYEFVRRAERALFPPGADRLLGVALSWAVPFVVTLLVCFLIFRIVPNRCVSARFALFGAAFTAVLWEGAKHLFAWYALAFGTYSIVYGSLSVVVVVLVWTYYSAAVLLLGAEVTALLEKVPADQPAGRWPCRQGDRGGLVA